MKNLIIVVLFVFWNSIYCNAQQISGKVCMESDRAPAQFASVGLMHLPDSGIVAGVITLTDGSYKFETVQPGDYAVKVSFMGYAIVHKSIRVTQSDYLVDTIYLKESSTSLQEVTVVGERLKGKEMVDRTTYTIPPLVAKSSSNGYDLLKKIPQVNVDFQNKITLNGSSNFIIEVDGRQRDREFLAKLLPADIESIDIISNPSGKYEGNIDGVISIILKKEARYGMNGNVSLNLKPFNKITYSGNGSLDYSMGKITFYITALTSSQNLYISTTNISHFKSTDSTNRMDGSGTIRIYNSSVNSGFDYYINDKNNLSFNVSYKPIGQDIKLNSETLLMKDDSPEQNLVSNTRNKTVSDEASASLFYKRTFKKPLQEFTAEASYYNFSSRDHNDFTNTIYPYQDEHTELSSYVRNELSINSRNYLSGKLNYIYPIGMDTKLEAGYQPYFQQMAYDFRTGSDAGNNLFEFSEFRNSFYGGITFGMKKLGIQAMMRVENTHIEADSVTSPDYTCLLPSFNIQYKFSATNNLKLTYNRRINRPGIYDMNPNWRIGQTYDISQGNPNLKPDYRDRFQLTHTWNFGSNYLSPSVYYEFLSDKTAQRYMQIKSPVDSSLTTFTKPFNLLNGYEMGATINTMLWFVNINARIFKGHFDAYSDELSSLAARDYYSFSVTSYAYTNLDKAKKTTAFVFISYNGVNVDAQSKTYSLPFYGLGAQKQIKDHSIGFVYLLPFSKNVNLMKTVTETPVYHLENTIGFDVSYYIQFMYSYKFNKGKNVKKIGHKIEVESDSKTQGIGM